MIIETVEFTIVFWTKPTQWIQVIQGDPKNISVYSGDRENAGVGGDTAAE